MSWLNPKTVLRTIQLGYRVQRMEKHAAKAIAIQEQFNQLPHVRCYRSRHSVFPLIVLHGLTRRGHDDPRLVRFCRVLAATGFTVYTPNLIGLQNLELDGNDIDLIVQTIGQASLPPSQPIGLMGFSLGGSYALIAAGQAAVADRVKFVLAAGAYASLPELFQHALAGSRPNPYAVMALSWPYQNQLGLSTADRQRFRDLMDHYCQREENFSENEKRLIQKIMIAAREKNILFCWRERLPELEPLSLTGNPQLKTIQADVFLLHGGGDEDIPATETAIIHQQLLDLGKRVHCHINRRGGHLDLAASPRIGLFRLFYRLLRLSGL